MRPTDLTAVTGAYPLDIDSDGGTDLVVLRHGENVLLRGLGECAFERANEAWGFDGGGDWTTAFSATWEDGAQWPTLAFGTDVDHFDEQHLAHCAPGSSTGLPARARFEPPSPLAPGRCALSMLFSDWDRSGRRDLRVTNDRHYYYKEGGEQLWMARPTPLRSCTRPEDGWKPVRIFGMGIAVEDLTGDGFPEFYLTSIGSNRLETLRQAPSAPVFADIAFDRGISATTPSIGRPINPSTSWHPEFDDVNNDGRIDLFVSKGNVDDAPDQRDEGPQRAVPGPSRWHASGGRRSAAGILSPVRTRGAALVDLNRDGLLDLVEVNRYENVNFRRNVGPRYGPEAQADRPLARGAARSSWPQPRGDRGLGRGQGRRRSARCARSPWWWSCRRRARAPPLRARQEHEADVRVLWPDGYQGRWLGASG